MRNYRSHCGHFTKPANCMNVRLHVATLSESSSVQYPVEQRSNGIYLNSKRSVRFYSCTARNRITSNLKRLKQLKFEYNYKNIWWIYALLGCKAAKCCPTPLNILFLQFSYLISCALHHKTFKTSFFLCQPTQFSNARQRPRAPSIAQSVNY